MGPVPPLFYHFVFPLLFSDEIKNDTLKDCHIQNAKDDTVMINYADLDEVEFIEENYDENEAGGLNEPERLSTVQEIEPTNEVK